MNDDAVGWSFLAVLLMAGFIALYFQITVWGPAENAERVAREKKAAIEAEARRVEVKNRVEVKAEATNKPFSAEFCGEFNGGFQNHLRQIFILTDNQTGNKYLAVTGCGVTEYFETYQVRENRKWVTKTREVEE